MIADIEPVAVTEPVRVVLVDARPERRSVMRQMFLSSDVDAEVVAEADGPAEAIDQVAEHGARLVVLDFPSAVQDGLGMVAALRGRFADLGIVVCSFNREASTREQALAQGADAYLLKPVTARDVLAAGLAPGRAAVPAAASG